MLQIGKYNNKKKERKKDKIFFLAQVIAIGMWKLLVDFCKQQLTYICNNILDYIKKFKKDLPTSWEFRNYGISLNSQQVQDLHRFRNFTKFLLRRSF